MVGNICVPTNGATALSDILSDVEEHSDWQKTLAPAVSHIGIRLTLLWNKWTGID